MRGKVLPGDPFQSFFGITPAYAGKSQIRSDLFGDDEGSPPPMRGKGTFGVDTSTTTGITPAYAGKSKEWRL